MICYPLSVQGAGDALMASEYLCEVHRVGGGVFDELR